MILYGVRLWLKPILATAAKMELRSVNFSPGTIRPEDIGAVWKAKCFSITLHSKTQVYDRLNQFLWHFAQTIMDYSEDFEKFYKAVRRSYTMWHEVNEANGFIENDIFYLF